MSHKIKELMNVHGTFRLPENKPDIECVLRATTFPHIECASTICKKIIFRGYLDLCIEYVAKTCDCSQPVYFVSFKLPFNAGVIEHCRIKENCNVQLKVRAEYLKVSTIDCRCIDCVAVFNVMLLQIANSCHHLPDHICIPYISHPHIFCCNRIAKTDVCQSDCCPCQPCDCLEPVQPCDNDPSECCDCMESECSIGTDCNSNHQYESCDCMTCDKTSTTYYQDCCSRNISIGT